MSESYTHNFDERIDMQRVFVRLLNDPHLATSKRLRLECLYVLVQRVVNNRTLSDIGKDLNRSPERIRQIQARTLRFLKHPAYRIVN